MQEFFENFLRNVEKPCVFRCFCAFLLTSDVQIEHALAVGRWKVAENRLQGPPQSGGWKWLGKEGGKAGLGGKSLGIDRSGRRQNDLHVVRYAVQASAELDAAHAGHVQVGNHELKLRRSSGKSGQSL